MYNNSEPYGRNEPPNNMLTQIAHTNNGLNFNFLDKTSSVSSQNSDEQFNAQAYSGFGQVPMSFEAPRSPFSTPKSDVSDDCAPDIMHPGLNFVAVDLPKVGIRYHVLLYNPIQMLC